MRIYYTAKDISQLLGVSVSKAYELIKIMNQELEKEGYLVLSGKVPIAYFGKRWYGLETMQKELQEAL